MATAQIVLYKKDDACLEHIFSGQFVPKDRERMSKKHGRKG